MREYKIEEYIIRQTHAGLYQHIVYKVYKDGKLLKTCLGFGELAKFVGMDWHALNRRMMEIDEREYSWNIGFNAVLNGRNGG